MTLYTAEIWLDEDNICNECPCHDDYIIADAPKCKLGEFYMVRENRGKNGTANLVTPRPRGCPLKPVEGK